MSVYFAESGPYMKIGYSADPTQRIGSVTRLGKRPSDLPKDADVDLIGWIPGDRRTEASMHRQFAELRVDGEWFWSEREAVRKVIWDDPRGVDYHAMSAIAVLSMLDYPTLTRDQIESAGVQILATPFEEAFDWIAAAIRGAA